MKTVIEGAQIMLREHSWVGGCGGIRPLQQFDPVQHHSIEQYWGGGGQPIATIHSEHAPILAPTLSSDGG